MAVVNTQDLTGAALDWAVGRANGWVTYPTDSIEQGEYWHLTPAVGVWGPKCRVADWKPSSNWFQGGTIIERENISVGYQGHLGVPIDSLWYTTNRTGAFGFGQTPLIATMRCYVADKIGPTVEVPEELAP